MKSITVTELKKKMDDGDDFQLIDVREMFENEAANINGKLIPMGEILERLHEIEREKPVIVHCRSGKRSANVIAALEQQHGFTNLYNLEGGIMAWASQIDPSLNVQ